MGSWTQRGSIKGGSKVICTRAARMGIPLALFLLVTSVASPAVGTTCPGWAQSASADVPGNYSQVFGISATSTDVWAVGGHRINGRHERTLTERWNGLRWSIVSSPNAGKGEENQLYGVAALSNSNVWAVGGHGSDALIEHWNGSGWRISRGASVFSGTSLQAVAGSASNDVWAVGYEGWRQYPLIEHWNGSAWTKVAQPVPPYTGGAQLFGVAALSPTDAWAVGQWQGEPLFLHWDGSSWSIVAGPSPYYGGGLAAVAAASPTDIWAVGTESTIVGGNYVHRPLMAHWDGSTWTQVAGPDVGSTADATGIAVLPDSEAWLVGVLPGGQQQTLSEHWDGTSWSIVQSPNPNQDAEFAGVALMPGSNTVWAGGDTWDYQAAEYRTLIASTC